MMDVTVVDCRGAMTRQAAVSLPSAARLADAIVAALGPAALKEVDPAAVGVFGELRGFDHPLEDGDRVELYGPLLIDPKTARRLRGALKRGRRGR